MPAASLIGPAIGAGSSLLGGLFGSSAASQAAAAQQAAEQNVITSNNQARDSSLSTLKGVYDNEQNAASPYQAAGTAALSQIGSSVWGGMPDAGTVLAQDPGYQFRADQGQQALERAAAASGGTGSGGALKAASRYSQDYASGEFSNAFNRLLQSNQQRFGQLSQLVGVGQTANGQMLSAGSTYGGDTANVTEGTARANAEALEGIGNAQASGYIGSANATSGALSGIGKTLGTYNWGGLIKKGSGSSSGGGDNSEENDD